MNFCYYEPVWHPGCICICLSACTEKNWCKFSLKKKHDRLFSFLAFLEGPRHKLRPVFACSLGGPVSDVGLTSWRSACRKGRVCLLDSLCKLLITPYARPTHHLVLLPRAGQGLTTFFSFSLLCRGLNQASPVGEIAEAQRRRERRRQRSLERQEKEDEWKTEHQKTSTVKVIGTYHSIHKFDAALQLWLGVTVLTE